MDRATVRRIISNHKSIQWVQDIIDGASPKLSVTEIEGKYVVYAGAKEKAVSQKNYIEFDSEETAKEFVEDYKKYFEDVSVEDMDQKEYEEKRGTDKWYYEGSIVDGQFSGTVERVG